jgi:ATP-dependent protease ClpP protease subunit
MLHQVSTGASGNIQDIRRSIAEGENTIQNYLIY